MKSSLGLSNLVLLTTICIWACTPGTNESMDQKPNIVLFYIDDLGYGDVSAYGATEIETPNIDFLAENGLVFSNGHSSSATCTPSRFSMLTGKYAWRQQGTGVARGDAPLLISPETKTIADIMKQAEYQTAVVGKWHLGLGPESGADWNGLITPGPQDLGFDYSFLIPATGDRVPTVYVENGYVVGLDPNDPITVNFNEKVGDEPTGRENPELLTKMRHSHGHDFTIVNGIGRIGWMSGGKSARWVDEDMADEITTRALAFIEKNREKPFFLYYSTHDIHVPRVPHNRFVGLSGMGPRGDTILEVDWAIGEIMSKLEDLGLAENTLVIFTSDNGPVVDDGYEDQAVELLGDHKPAGPLRGGKYSSFEAGTRVPLITYWPGRIKPAMSDALISQVDFPHSLAALNDIELGEGDVPDSFNMLEALLGNSPTGREWLVEQARGLSIIKGDWKYIEPNNGARYARFVDIELGNDTLPQLYKLVDDINEQNNLAFENPEKLEELRLLLEEIKQGN